MPKAKEMQTNCAARNAVWVYPQIAEPCFPGTPAIVEMIHSYKIPNISPLPEWAGVTVKLYGRACALWIDGEGNRIYVRRFHYAGFTTQGETRRAFLDLWREVGRLGSAEEVEQAAEGWLERQG